jgi:serine/threonine protein kinase
MGLCPECLVKAGFATGGETGSPTDEQAAFVPPTVAEMAGYFPQLEILEFIGKGGMGAVYKARQKQLDRIVALKILPPGVGAAAGFAERFTREARALAKLNHPAIVTLFEFGQASGLYFFLMEFVDGVNLRQLLATRQISSREALAIVPQICDALQFAHDQGIVHRDIKPENILLDRRGRVKLADFGLAKLVGAGNETAAALPPIGGTSVLTEAGKVMGTPNYMAPEQLEHPSEVDNRADIYALGVVFYQMLTGELPGKPLEPPSHKVRMDVRLDEVVLRALEQKPELRYQQASEIKTRVETIAGTPPPVAGFAAPPNTPVPPGSLPPGTPSPLPPGRPGAPARGGDMVTAPAIALIVIGGFLLVMCLFVAGVAAIAGVAISHLGHEINNGFNQDSSKSAVHQDINLTFPLAPDGSFSLDNVDGPIAITGWDQDQVVVKGVKSGPSQEAIDAVKIDVSADTNRIVIHTRQPSGNGLHWNWSWFNNNNVKVEYTVQVPWHTRLEKIEDVNGKITISGVDGDIAASTVNGEAAVRDATGNLKMVTVNGRIVAEFARLKEGQDASLNTVNGKIEVTLPADADATVSANTVNGGISSDFPALTVKREFPISSHLNGTLGNGSARVHAVTVNGAIHFEQGGAEGSGQPRHHKVSLANPGPSASVQAEAEEGPTLADLPPVVVETDPVAGAHDVAPGVTEIRVRFSKSMAERSWSWCTVWDDSNAENTGQPHYLADHRTCVLPVKLASGTSYGYWLNSENFQGFADKGGRAAVPYLLTFRTKGNAVAPTREAGWRRDLDYFKSEFPQRHLDFSKLVAPADFSRAVDDLKQQVPTLSDAELILGLMHIVAGVGVAHTGLDWSPQAAVFHQYPLQVRWCSDGLGVAAAAEEYRAALGARVLQIGTLTPEQLEQAEAPYISHENAAWLHQQSPSYMVMAELLQHLKVANADGSVDVSLARDGGAPFTLHLVPSARGAGDKHWVAATEALHTPTPLYGRHPKTFYWREFLPESRTLYVQYNKCAEAPDQPFSQFVAETLAFAATNPVARVVVDLRLNAGGSSEVIQPLLDGLENTPALSAKGHLFVLISGHTFSSGVMDAMYLQDRLHAVLVGRPTGGKPNCYGEIKEMELPVSHLGISYPVKHFQSLADRDPASLEPDVKVSFTWPDYLAGRDPDLDAVLHQPE